MRVFVLRLGHRLPRDERITTHVGLVARAFGADGVVFSGERDDGLIESMARVSKSWGGQFKASYEKNWRSVLSGWKGDIVHLTFYGEQLDGVMPKIINSKKDKLIVVGSEKVPYEVYERATWNVGVGNQPHSEVAALTIFLDRLFGGRWIKKKFRGARLTIIPQKHGKLVKETLKR